MKPGATTWFAASMTRVPASGVFDTAAMRPPVIPTCRTASSPDSGSMTRPLATTRSYDDDVVFVHAATATVTVSAIHVIERMIPKGSEWFDRRGSHAVIHRGPAAAAKLTCVLHYATLNAQNTQRPSGSVLRLLRILRVLRCVVPSFEWHPDCLTPRRVQCFLNGRV